MSFREEVWGHLTKDYGVNSKSIAKALAHVMSGQTVKEDYVPNKEGELKLVKVSKTTKPADVMAGLVIADALSGGELGLSQAAMSMQEASKIAKDQFKPRQIDSNLLHNPGGIGCKTK